MSEFNLGTARGKVEIDASGVGKGLAEADRELDKFGSKGEKTAAQLRGAGTVMVGAAAGIAAGFGVAINAASDFETRMSAIKAVSGATEGELETLRKKALKLGADTKFSASEAGGAMEELVKAGLSVEEVLNGAADATVNLAAAGEIDLVSAATLAANAMNAFGLSAEEMPKIADLIAGAANASAIDVGEFGQSMQQAGAVANLVGLSFDDMAVAIAAMGNAGIKGSDAGTSLKTFLSNLQPVTKKQTELFKELGIVTENGANQFFTAEGSIKSMSEIAGVLGKSLEGMSDQQKAATLEAMFGSDAIRAAAIIADTGAKGFDDLAASMGKVTAQEVAETRMDNLAGSIEQLKGSVETLLIIIGRPLAEALRAWVDRITGVINWLSALDEDTLQMITTIGKVVAAFLGTAGAALIFISYIDKIGKAFTALRLIMAAHPLLLIIGAIIALGVALYTLYQNNEQFRDAVNKLFATLKATVMPIIEQIVLGFKAMIAAFNGDGITSDGIVGWFERVGVAARAVVDWVTGKLIPALKDMADFFMAEVVPVLQDVADVYIWLATEILERVVGGFNWLVENVGPVIVAFGELLFAVGQRIFGIIKFIIGVIKFLSPVFLAAFGIIKGIITAFITVVSAAWDRFGTNIINAIMIAFNLVKSIVEAALKIIQGVIQVVTGIISLDWGKTWEGIKNILAGVWDAMAAVVRAVWETIKNYLSIALNALKGLWNTVWGVIGDFLKGVWETIKNAVYTGIGAVINFFKELPRKILDAIVNLGQMLWDFFTAAVGRAKTGATNIIQEILQYMRNVPQMILNALGDVGRFLYEAGKKIIQGLIDGIKAMAGKLGDAAGAVIGKVSDWIPGSPVKKGPLRVLNKGYAGEQIVKMLLDGMESGLKSVNPALLGLNNIVPTPVGAPMAISSPQPTGNTSSSIGITLNFPGVTSAKEADDIRSALRDPSVLTEVIRAARSGTGRL